MRPLIKTGLVATSFLFAAAQMAFADTVVEQFEDDRASFSRVFDSDHMKNNKKQQVEWIRVSKAVADNDQANDSDDEIKVVLNVVLSAKFRDASDPVDVAGQCTRGKDGMLDCRVGCKGTGFFLMPGENKGLLLLNPQGISFDKCEENGAEVRTIKPIDEDAAYALVRENIE